MPNTNRNSPSDFARDVAASGKAAIPTTSINQYVATLNPSGTHTIFKNGQPTGFEVFWSGNGAAGSDSNPQGDKVMIKSAEGIWSVGSAAAFLRNLV